MEVRALIAVSRPLLGISIMALPFVLCSALVSFAQSPSASVWDGVFTKEQAASGEDVYETSCAACHGDDLKATNEEAVDLTGPSFLASWMGKNVGERLKTIRDTMPKGNPGSLSQEQYLDILAYIFQFNKFPAGTQKLTADAAGRIVVTAKKN